MLRFLLQMSINYQAILAFFVHTLDCVSSVPFSAIMAVGGKKNSGAGRGRGGKAPVEEAPSAKKLRFSIESRTKQKIAENLKFLTPGEIDCVVDPHTQQTCRQRIEADLRLKDEGLGGENICTKNTTTTTTTFLYLF